MKKDIGDINLYVLWSYIWWLCHIKTWMLFVGYRVYEIIEFYLSSLLKCDKHEEMKKSKHMSSRQSQDYGFKRYPNHLTRIKNQNQNLWPIAGTNTRNIRKTKWIIIIINQGHMPTDNEAKQYTRSKDKD